MSQRVRPPLPALEVSELECGRSDVLRHDVHAIFQRCGGLYRETLDGTERQLLVRALTDNHIAMTLPTVHVRDDLLGEFPRERGLGPEQFRQTNHLGSTDDRPLVTWQALFDEQSKCQAGGHGAE